MSASDLIFGFPEEWQAFRDRNTLFLERFPALKETLDAAFIREFSSIEPIDRFVMMFGRMCIEDFFEILILCGNGYGIAASRLLRALYEKALTLAYLDAHPEELDDFFEFHHVSQYKLFNSIKNVLGKDALPPEIVAENAAEYERVKEHFMVNDCKKCGTKRVHHTWNKLDIVTMANKTRIFGKIINEAYYLPMRHTHSTVSSLIERLEQNSAGAIGFNPDSQRPLADSTLRTAHLIVLELLTIQDKRYKLPGLEEKIDKCEKDWITIYEKDTKPDDSAN